MIQVLAPRMRRECSWVWLSIVLAGTGWHSAAVAQDTKPAPPTTKGSPEASKKKDAAAPKAGDAPAVKPETAPEPEPEAASPVGKFGAVEVFKDENTEKALTIFKSIPGLRDTTPSVVTQVKTMAAAQANVDRDTIQKFVQGMAYRLVDKSNINGLINPAPGTSPNSFAARAIKETAANLIDVLNSARQVKNTSFLTEYNRALIDSLPKLLDNNLVARIEAIIVLGQTGDPNVVPILLEQLKKKDQSVWVKLWSARGLVNVVDGGGQVDSSLSVQRASDAGKTLADWLGGEEALPWPAKMRALEGIAAMRQAALPVAPQKVEMASAAMKIVSDPSDRPEVRAAASLTLGMVRVNPLVAKYNFPLVAYQIGRLSAELGEVAAAQLVDNPTLSEYMTGLLVGPIFQAFNGVEGARESGLLKIPTAHPNIGPNLTYIRQIADLQSSVARAAVEMIRSPTGTQPARRKDLGDRVAALKAFLDKNPPKDFHLVPGGSEYKPADQAAMAEAEVKVNVNAAAKPAPGARGGR